MHDCEETRTVRARQRRDFVTEVSPRIPPNPHESAATSQGLLAPEVISELFMPTYDRARNMSRNKSATVMDLKHNSALIVTEMNESRA